MRNFLIGMIILGLAAFVAVRFMPSSSPGGQPATGTLDGNDGTGTGGAGSVGPGSNRFQQLMAKATGEGASGEPTGEGLRQYVNRVDPNRLTFRELNELLGALENDPETALLLMDRVLSDPERQWSLVQKETLLRKAGVLAASADAGSLTSRLDQLDEFSDRVLFVQGAAEGLAVQEIEKSLMWIESLGEGALQAPAFRGVGKAWGAQDRDLALQWAEGLEDPEEKAQALKGLVAGWALVDADKAFEYANEAPESMVDGLIVEAAESLVLSDPKKASQEVVMAINDPKAKLVLEESVVAWADDDFEGVAAWSMFVSNSALRDTAMISLAGHWSEEDPKKATEWADEFPTADAKARMLAKTVPQWVQTNPSEAAEWFQDRPVDLPQINLLRQTLQTIGEEDPSVAADFLNLIDEPGLKQVGQAMIQSLQ